MLNNRTNTFIMRVSVASSTAPFRETKILEIRMRKNTFKQAIDAFVKRYSPVLLPDCYIDVERVEKYDFVSFKYNAREKRAVLVDYMVDQLPLLAQMYPVRLVDMGKGKPDATIPTITTRVA